MRYIGFLLGVWIVTAIDRTAYPRFKRVVPARELVEAFTPTVAEVAWAREKTQNDQHLLALVVWLKSYQRLGYFPKLDEVPAVVVQHMRGLLDLSGEVTAEHDADRTAKWHRSWAGPGVGGREVRRGQGPRDRRGGDPPGGHDEGQSG
ncbi:hypothetical protein ABIA39_009108 [Nocardia sp. GAS34]|uniref:DUF4158 domain-containing protein n=1 Tax=unclassified Nocardia TaxID=2637762 RepID=UPI003D1A90BB